jgi:hypothetical protein
MGAGAPPDPPERGLVARLVRRELDGARATLRDWAAGVRWLWQRRPSAPRAIAILFVCAALAAGALSVVAQASLPGRLPSARDWSAVAALLDREARPGDAVALSPSWAERARAVLPAKVPVLAGGDLAREDLVGVRRLWLLSIPGAPRFSWESEVALLQRASRAGAAERIGAFELARYDLSHPTLPLAFLPDRLAQAEVTRGDEPCVADATGAFRCAGARLAREMREVAGAPRPCLAAALRAGAPVVIAFPPLRVGRLLRGHAGALGPTAGPLRVSVLVDGEEAGAAELAGREFAPFEIDTTRFGGEQRRLSLVLTTASEADVCLDALTLP